MLLFVHLDVSQITGDPLYTLTVEVSLNLLIELHYIPIVYVTINLARCLTTSINKCLYQFLLQGKFMSRIS